MLLRVVIVGYGNPQGLSRTLDSLVTNLKAPAEIVVFDNGGAREAVAAWRPASSPAWKLLLKGDGKNLGFSAAVNRSTLEGELEAPWTHLLLLNPDATLASALGREEVEKLAALGGLCGLRVFDDVDRQHRQASARRFPSWLTSITGREGLLTRFWPGNPWSQRYLARDLDGNSTQDVDWLSGCALFVSKADWARLKGFDESYFLYVEDVDLGRRARALKLPVRYAPVADVVHEGRGSASSVPWRSDYYHHMGMWVYHVKWSGPLGLLFGPLVFVAIWTRFLFRRLKS